MAHLRIVRIVHEKYADDPFSGDGGLFAASRWASRGQRVSYAADSLALAALEKIAGAGQLTRLREMVWAVARLDEDAVEAPSLSDLPEGWDRRPPGRPSQVFGDAWLEKKEAVALRVPSVVLPEGWNYVLNPAHPDYREALTLQETNQLDLDPRVLKRLHK